MVSFIFKLILPPFFYFYEKHVMYRVKMAWGVANLRRIKNKGSNVKVMGYTRFLNPENIVLGDNVRIGYGCFLFGLGGIEIGDNSILSRNITIYSSNHDYNGQMIPYSNENIHKPVKIGKGVWIGMGVSITPGVVIGDGAIIGMGTVISKNVLDGEIIVGSGQRKISNRDLDKFNDLIKDNKIFSLIYPDKWERIP